jgi:hypothetical protein
VVPEERRCYTFRYSSVLYAVCGEVPPANNTVFNWIRSFNNGQETEQAAVHGRYHNISEDGSVKPTRSSKGDGTDV